MGAWYATVAPRRGPEQRGAERSGGADDVEVVDTLLDVTDEVALGLVVGVALVDEGDDAAGPDDAFGGRGDDLGVLEDVLELADASLHVALLVLGRVVVAVLGEVAELARPLDLLGHLDSTAGGQVVELGAQTVVRLLRQLVRLHSCVPSLAATVRGARPPCPPRRHLVTLRLVRRSGHPRSRYRERG